MFIVLLGPELLRWNRWCIVKSSLSSNWLRGSLKFPKEHWCCSSLTWRNTEIKSLCIICFVRIQRRKLHFYLKTKNTNNIECSLFLNQISPILRLLYIEGDKNKYTQCLVSSTLPSTGKVRQKTNHHICIYLTHYQHNSMVSKLSVWKWIPTTIRGRVTKTVLIYTSVSLNYVNDMSTV